jgi:hypothetical protein
MRRLAARRQSCWRCFPRQLDGQRTPAVLYDMSRTATYYAYYLSYGYPITGRGWRRTRD